MDHDIVKERRWRHHDPPVEAKDAIRRTAPPALPLVAYEDRRWRDAEQRCEPRHPCLEPVGGARSVPSPERGLNGRPPLDAGQSAGNLNLESPVTEADLDAPAR